MQTLQSSLSIIYTLTLENNGRKRLLKHEMTNQLDLCLIENHTVNKISKADGQQLHGPL